MYERSTWCLLFLTSQIMCLRESCMRENRTCSLGGGRRLARKRASSDRLSRKTAFWKVGAVKVRRDLDVSRAFHQCDRCCNHAFQCREELFDLPAAAHSVDLT